MGNKRYPYMDTIAIYPGTFDPITFGHIDVIERAIRLFDQVIVAIAENKNKTPLFTLAERVQLTQQAISQYQSQNKNKIRNTTSIQVQGFDSLLFEFAKKTGANVILRGLRTVTDFDYEFQLASMNRVLNPAIESLFLMPAEKYMCISSSLVREVAAFGGDVTSFVPNFIAEAMAKKNLQTTRK